MVADPQAAASGRNEIVLISNGFQVEYQIGFANGLARNGLKPLLVGSSTLPPDRLDPGVDFLNLRGSQDPRRSPLVKTANILRYWGTTIRLLRRTQPRVVHLIGLFTLRSTVAALLEVMLFRLVSRRLVLTVHNLLPHDAHGRFNRLAYRMIYRVPHTLVVHTHGMRDELTREFGIPASRAVVMEHGIDRVTPPSVGQRHWLRKQLNLDPSRCILLFFGNVARYKGLDLLIQAFEQLPAGSDAVLVIAGLCRDATLTIELRAQLKPLLMSQRAFWIDRFLPEEQVIQYFHGADLLIMPYRHIDQSGVIFTALATGLPVVAADVGSLKDYVPLTSGRVVPPGDASALAVAIETMVPCAQEIDRDRVVDQARRFLWVTTVLPLLPEYRLNPDMATR